MYGVGVSTRYEALGWAHCSSRVKRIAAPVVYITPRSPPHQSAVRIETGYKNTPTCNVGVSHTSTKAMVRSKRPVSRLCHERGGSLSTLIHAASCVVILFVATMYY